MYFKFSLRKHPHSGKLRGNYRLVESHRNADNRVCQCAILNVGFMEDVRADQLNKIQKQLTEKYERKQPLFQGEDDPTAKRYVKELWQRIVASKRLDLLPAENLSRMVNMDTLQHSNAWEIGAENIAHQTWGKLQITPLLLSCGFTLEQAMLAATQVVSRAVYPASELKTARWIKENSAVCGLTGYDTDKVSFYTAIFFVCFLELFGCKVAECGMSPHPVVPYLDEFENLLFCLHDVILTKELGLPFSLEYKASNKDTSILKVTRVLNKLCQDPFF